MPGFLAAPLAAGIGGAATGGLGTALSLGALGAGALLGTSPDPRERAFGTGLGFLGAAPSLFNQLSGNQTNRQATTTDLEAQLEELFGGGSVRKGPRVTLGDVSGGSPSRFRLGGFSGGGFGMS